MLNKVILIGRLVDDPELRYTDGGTPFTIFTLAIDRNYTNSSGEKETDFIDIITWRRRAENCSEFLRKGILAAVEGRIQIVKNEKEDVTYYNPQVVANNVSFLEWPEQPGQKESNKTERKKVST